MKTKLQARRERIYEFHLANRSHGKKVTLDHFKKENIPQKTIYRIIELAENDSGHERVKGSGRIAKIMTKPKIKQLKTLFNHHQGISYRKAAKKFGCSYQHIYNTLRQNSEIKFRQQRTIPLRTDGQLVRIRICCDRLYRKLQNKSAILDDESYFTLSHSRLTGNTGFYTDDISQTPANVKYRKKAKFEPKLLVWLAISDKGMSRPYFAPSGLAVNQKVYLEECIKKRLLPFINEHHSDGEYLFWPDLASSHYANSVISFFQQNSINFVTRADNPPCVPECRPIENFWSILKRMVYAENWHAKNITQLQARIIQCLEMIDIQLVKDLAGSTRRLVGNIRTHDVIENR